VSLVVYNHNADILEVNRENYRKVIAATIAQGKTCFASAFNCVGKILRDKGIVGKKTNLTPPSLSRAGSTTILTFFSISGEKEGGDRYEEVVIGLMTDGKHTTKNNVTVAFNALSADLKAAKCKKTTFHTIGFTNQHNFKALDVLRKMG